MTPQKYRRHILKSISIFGRNPGKWAVFFDMSDRLTVY